MGMEINNYNRYKKIYENYMEIYDLPLIKTDFFQDDYRAMNYCEDRDFVALVVPFGDPEGELVNSVIVQNDLISYTKMYSDLLGGGANQEKDFLRTAIEIANKKAGMKNLEEYTPIALIENTFTFRTKKQSHYGVVFMARIPKGKRLNKKVVSRTINENVYFANPHNQVLFKLAKKYVENYKTNKMLQDEIKYSRRVDINEIKNKKKQFLLDNNIDLTDYYMFKKGIVDDIKKISPKSIMDIACGDDDIIYDFVKINKNIKVFANDIALAYLEKYHYKKEEHMKIIFSNLNAVELPLKRGTLDVIFCKNLLHHLCKDDRIKMISNCMKICKTMIIVEVLCYEQQNDTGKMLHDMFYNKILNETKSKEYLTEEQIDELTKVENIHVSNSSVVETQNGRYKYIWISPINA